MRERRVSLSAHQRRILDALTHPRSEGKPLASYTQIAKEVYGTAKKEGAVKEQMRAIRDKFAVSEVLTPGQKKEEVARIYLEWQASQLRQEPVIPKFPARDTRFVARGDEIARLSGLLARARDEYKRQVVLLEGEAGVGKTRVCEELASRWERDGAFGGLAVLYGRFDPEAGEYRAIAEALKGYLDHWPENTLLSQRGDRGPWLTDFMDGRPKLDPRVDPGVARDRLFHAVCELLQRIAQGGPAVLVLDDLHEADADSRALLERVVCETADSALVCIFTYQRGADEELGEFLEQMREDYPGALTELALERLDQPATRELAETVIGHALSDAQALELYRETAGLPYEIGEIYRCLLAGDREDDRATAGAALDRTPEEVGWLLAIGAHIGAQFTADVLAGVTQRSLEEVGKTLEWAVDGGIIVCIDEGAPTFGFAHDLQRRAVASAYPLSDQDRTRLSHRAAQTLEALGAPKAQVARLWKEAGKIDQAVRSSQAAADDARRALAYEEAARHDGTALELLEEQQADPRVRCEIALRLGRALLYAGQSKRSAKAFRDAADLAQKTGDSDQLAEAALGFAGRHGFQGVTNDQSLVGLLTLALDRLPNDDSPQRARLTASLGLAVTFKDRARSEQLSTEAEDMARRLTEADPEERWVLLEVLCKTCWATWRPHNLDHRRELADEIVALAVELKRPAEELEGLIYRICVAMEAGEVELAHRDRKRSARLARELRQSYYESLVTFIKGMLALFDGRDHEAETLARRALQRGRWQDNSHGLIQLFGAQMLAIALHRGCDELEWLLPASRLITAYFSDMAPWQAGLAMILAETGREAEASQVLNELLDGDPAALQQDMFWLSTMDHVTRAWCTLAAHGLAPAARLREAYELLHDYAGQFAVLGGAVAVQGPVSHLLGHLSVARGDEEQARLHFLEGYRDAKMVKCRPAIVEAEVELAALSEDLSEAIRDYLQPAVNKAEELGLGRLAERAATVAAVLADRASAAGEESLVEEARALEDRATSIAEGNYRQRTSAAPGRRAMSRIALRGAGLTRRWLAKQSDSELEAKFRRRHSQRIVFHRMASLYQPDIGMGFAGEIGFEITFMTAPSDVAHWTITVQGRKAHAQPGRPRDPAVSISLSVRDFAGLLTSSLNGVEAWVDRRVRVDGDPILAARLVEMFGGDVALGGLR